MNPNQPPRGWWLASDGRWYAPELHPDARMSAPAPHGGETAGTEISHVSTPTHRGRSADGRRALRSPWVWGTAMATILMLAVLLVTGPGKGPGTSTAPPPSSSASARGPSSPAPASPGSGSGSSPGATVPTSAPPSATAAPAVAAASPATASKVVVGPAGADVSVNQCVMDPSDTRHAVVNGTVVNHDTQTDDYTITVAIQQGGQTVGSAFVPDDQVAVGADAPWSARGTVSAGVSGDLTCTVTYVSRTSS